MASCNAAGAAPRPRRPAQRIVPALLALLLASAAGAQKPVTRTVRVGVWEGAPVVFRTEDGSWDGLAMVVLDAVARAEGWRLEYVVGTWEQSLGRLAAGEIDLLVGIAYSEERTRRFRFNKVPLVSDWAVIYRHPSVDITSIPDLAGKRLVRLEGSIHNTALDELLRRFRVRHHLDEVADFGEVLELVEAGKADAGVINRLFFVLHSGEYNVVATGIVFDPIEVHYAAPGSADGRLLDAIDRHLERLKADQSSVYHLALNRWLTGAERRGFPKWLYGLLAGAGITVLVVLLNSILLRRQVRSRTRELVTKSHQLEREVAERKLAQDQLNRLAFYDGLTGLPNRFLFRDHLRQALAAAEPGALVALLFVDVDRFKSVNDSFGHSTGDDLLRGVAARLGASLRDGDTLCRLGGDEFTIILSSLTSAEEATRVAGRIVASCRAPFDLWESRVYATVSVGIALYPRDASDPDGLLRAADAAMYFVKQHGRHGYRLYSPELTAQATERLTLEAELREALAEGELEVHYQPILHLAQRQVTGVEALLRLRHPSRGWLPSEDVIPVAEEAGLIQEIGDRVLDVACRQMQAWNTAGLQPLRLNVNVSSRQFAGERLLTSVDRALEESRLPASNLEVELTESLFVDGGPASTRLLEALRERKIRICIDDFGTGYSSLSYLQRLPLDSLKIDRSFVEDIPRDRRAERITAGIIAMASGLDLEVIAEGIETEAQLDYLLRHGCTYGQGFLLGRPMAAPELEPWLRSFLIDQ